MKRRVLVVILLMTPWVAAWCAEEHAATVARSANAVPQALEDWQSWVLKGQEFYRCPVRTGADFATEESHVCAWPGRLQLSANATGGEFSQHWQVYSESWVPLPGDAQYWPQDVQLDGAAAPVVARNERPYVQLSPGGHLLQGRWQWHVRPETLPIPAETALLDLSVDGASIAQPDRGDARVSLGRQHTAVEPRQLQVQVYRLVLDDIPLRIVTKLQLRAAGDAREESLGHAIPEGFEPISLTGSLPAHLERDGTLNVQVRPGTFDIELVARQARADAALRLPRDKTPAQEEIWSFAANDRLRVAAAEGAPSVDPLQAHVPTEWRTYPAFRMTPQRELRISERSRGLSASEQNHLHLQRAMWLDFDHEGWTVRDEITGTLRRDWRLDMQTPFSLQSARAGGESLLVTQGKDATQSGVEIRSPRVQLSALSRATKPFGSLPATGWTTAFEGAAGELHLPPGHRLLAALGADQSPTTWLDRWGLWNLFGVLVLIVFARWVAGWKGAVLGGVGLILSYQAAPALIWGWAVLLASIALARAAPEGRLASALRILRTCSFVLMGLVLIPFVWTEVRHSIYPQLDVTEESAPEQFMPMADRGKSLSPPRITGQVAGAALNAPAVEAPPPIPEPSESITSEREDNGSVESDQLAAKVSIAVPRSVRISSSSLLSPLAAYAPGTPVQAGPGIPSWRYSTHPFGWSGPIDPGQTVRFIVLGPLAVALWRIGAVVLLVAFYVHLVGTGLGRARLWTGGLSNSATVVTLLLLCGVTLAPMARADTVPSPAMLNELRARLTEAPHCTPTCAELTDARIRINGDQMSVELSASALAPTAIAIPSGGNRWQIDAVTVDAVSSIGVERDGASELWLPLSRGVHQIRIQARVPGDSLHVAFPMTPRHVSVDATGWDAAGVNAARLVSGAIDLTRQRRVESSGAAARASDGQDFAAFVRVIRDIRLDLDWSVSTTVERIAPASAALTVSIPLLPGEFVLSEGLNPRADGTVLVGLAAGESSRSWNSSLKREDALKLSMPAAAARTEVWRFVVSPQWGVSFGGMPATLPEDSDASPWVFEYHPRGGEALQLSVQRRDAVSGHTLAIDQAMQSITVGRRSSESTLQLRYRSTQGGRQGISIPDTANVTGVALDGTPVPIRPEKGELSLPLRPGEHSVSIEWRTPVNATFSARPTLIDLHTPASNVTTRVSISADRWPLFALGRGVGPAFLYWGELLVFLVVATLLGRWRFSPLRTIEWLLLGLGLSTLSWAVFVLVAMWLFALSWRERAASVARLSESLFNLLQVGLAILTLIAVSSLVFSGIRYGLLSAPDMGVAGPGSSQNAFTWFLDRTTSSMPQPVVYSLPMWVYRVIMFAWALWIALALVRWLRMAWRAWSTGGFWRGAGSVVTTPRA